MRKILFLILFLLIPTLSFGQAGTPVTVGPWYLLNEQTDLSGEVPGCYRPDEVTFAPNNLQISMHTRSVSCGNFNHTTTTNSYAGGALMWHDFNVKPTAGHNVVIEFKAKMDLGWTAFWMLGGNKAANTGCQISTPQTWDNASVAGFGTCQWADDTQDSAEVDIAEECPPFTTGNQFYAGHAFFGTGGTGNGDISCYNSPNALTGFHLYHYDWSTTQFCFAIDGVQQECATHNIPLNPMFMLMEIRQLSGNSVSLPRTATVQYVQVCDGGSGTACSSPNSPVGVGNTTFFDNFNYPPPQIFFTDLTVGPNSGGESVSGFAGAYVTLYGNNFLTTQGNSTVTWNGQSCLRVVNWETNYLWYQKMVVQLGPSCTPGTGNFVVTTPTGSSTGFPFTVNAIGTNKIVFAASGGSDSNPGTVASPFLTMIKCKNVLNPGDICYVKGGLASGVAGQPLLDNFGSVDLCTVGTPTAPLAMIAYPGTNITSTIGADTRDKGLFINGAGGCPGGQYWSVSGFILRANTMAVQLYSSHNRIVANLAECPAVAPGTAEGCIEPASASFQAVIGNEITNLGPGGKLFHALYFGADGHDYEAGWNSIHDLGTSCRGIQVFNGAIDSFNISIHDNLIFNTPCDGIGITAVNPNLGFVNVFNNTIYNAGKGPDEGAQNATCISISAQGAPTVPVKVYNNSFYNCGALGSSDSAMMSPFIPTQMFNNIVLSNGTEPYFTNASGSTHLSGSNNVWSGRGNGPTQTTSNVNLDPKFVAIGATPDLHLAVGSPAIGTGTATQTTILDHDGLIRSAPPSIGAFEFSAGVAPPVFQTDIYLAQAAAGLSDGTSCVNARAASFFNSSANWGTTSGQIGSGITLHLCGTISTVFTTPTSQGTGLITVVWETGAKLSAPANQNFIVVNNTNQWKFNGGFPCGPQVGGTVTCNGIIENTANGTDRTNQVSPVRGFELSNATGAIEITGLDIRNLYVHTRPITITNISSNGTTQVTVTCATTCGKVAGESGLSIEGTTNYNSTGNLTVTSTSGTTIVFTYPSTVTAATETAGEIDDGIVANTSINCEHANPVLASLTIHDSDCHDVSWAFDNTPVTGSAGATINLFDLDIFNIDHGPTLGGTNTNSSVTFKLHDSHIHNYANWDSGVLNSYHHDGFHFFNSQTQAAEVDIYNNLFDFWDGINNTAPMFNQQSLANTKIFNNVVKCDPAQNCLDSPLALHEGGGGPNQLFVNNTFIQSGLTRLTPPFNQSNNACVQQVITGLNISGNNTMMNNIITSCTTMIDVQGATFAANTTTSGLDYNLYANRITDGNPAFNWNGSPNTNVFATWQAASGEGIHSQSIAGSANLSSTGAPLAGSAAIAAGTNLTSLATGNLAALAFDTSLGNSRVPIARPSVGAWDIGAFAFTGGSPLASLAPSPALFGNTLVATPSIVLITVSNPGTATLTLNTPFFTITGTNAADFANSGGTCVNGGTVLVGNSCTVQITFMPSAGGTRTATLNVNGNASTSGTLSGFGLVNIISGPSSISGKASIKVNP